MYQRKLMDQLYETVNQPYYKYTDGLWHAITNNAATQRTKHGPSKLRLITWNIDFRIGGEKLRMGAALDYLDNMVTDSSVTTTPTVILFQEMTLSDLKQIQASKWIQQGFHITDISNQNWSDKCYGTTTLVDKNLCIEKISRVYYKSNMGRDALLVDIALPPESEEPDCLTSSKILRIGNAHLESLVAEPPLRPNQVATAARCLQAAEVHGGVLAGDYNAIQDFDRTLHSENSLQDAYLSLGGSEDHDDGYTWGFQSTERSMKMFGPCRMDKVLFCGGVRIDKLERVGVGAKVHDSEREHLRRLTGGLDWITDHYGLLATFTII